MLTLPSQTYKNISTYFSLLTVDTIRRYSGYLLTSHDGNCSHTHTHTRTHARASTLTRVCVSIVLDAIRAMKLTPHSFK